MKANELMIGDWVLHNSKPKRVDVIWGREVSLYDPEKTFGSVYADKYSVEEIEPIPLTAEFLNRNGMHLSNRKTNSYLERCNHCDFFEEDKYYFAELSLDFDGKIRWSINDDEYSILPLDYVHQLQHVLRLCDINKQIIL